MDDLPGGPDGGAGGRHKVKGLCVRVFLPRLFKRFFVYDGERKTCIPYAGYHRAEYQTGSGVPKLQGEPSDLRNRLSDRIHGGSAVLELFGAGQRGA